MKVPTRAEREARKRALDMLLAPLAPKRVEQVVDLRAASRRSVMPPIAPGVKPLQRRLRTASTRKGVV